MIEQILNNALKYARGKDIWITFDQQQHVLTIRDNGVGISQADLKIFDKGYSGYNGRLNANSSGIGLFIVKHISQHLHHYVDVQSELNKGTVLVFISRKIKLSIFKLANNICKKLSMLLAFCYDRDNKRNLRSAFSIIGLHFHCGHFIN